MESGGLSPVSPYEDEAPNMPLPLLAICAIPTSQLFPIESWKPRAGRNAAFFKWYSGINQLFAAYGLTMEQLNESVPSAQGAQLKDRLRQTPEQAAATAASIRASINRWQRINTAIYWHVRPSLVITGPEFQKDTRFIDSLYERRLADGRKLVQWALGFVNTSGTTSQIKIAHALMTTKLKAGASRAQLSVHAQNLLQLWLLLSLCDARPAQLASDGGRARGGGLRAE